MLSNEKRVPCKVSTLGMMTRGRDDSDLSTLPLKSIEDGLKRRIAEAAFHALLLVVFISRTKPLWAVIEGVPKWFVDTFKRVAASHKDLETWSALFVRGTVGEELLFRMRSSMPEDGLLQRWVYWTSLKSATNCDVCYTPIVLVFIKQLMKRNQSRIRSINFQSV